MGAAGLALAGCGGTPSETGNAMTGKGLFTSGCGSCHVLEDAGTAGRIGPNLDDAFRGARLQGWETSQIHAVTREWIELAEPPMPRDIYTGQEAEDVAAYVASVAGKSPESPVRAPAPAGGSAPDSPAGVEGETPAAEEEQESAPGGAQESPREAEPGPSGQSDGDDGG